MKKCSVTDCNRKQVCKKFCDKHYRRFKKHGDPLYEGRDYHGMHETPTYSSWGNMKQRCLNPNTKKYKDYGGRGIKICDSWINSFSNFYKDMGDKPEGHELDRIDVNGDYTPENCKWSNRQDQLRNQRTRIDNKSGCRGVYKRKDRVNWYATIAVGGKHIPLGTYISFEEAVVARLKGELEHWGYIQQKQFEHLLYDQNI